MKRKVRCPKCGSGGAIRNGRTRHGRQNYLCRGCGRQFVLRPAGRLSPEVRGIVERMIERGYRAPEIAAVAGVSRSWVYRVKGGVHGWN